MLLLASGLRLLGVATEVVLLVAALSLVLGSVLWIPSAGRSAGRPVHVSGERSDRGLGRPGGGSCS